MSQISQTTLNTLGWHYQSTKIDKNKVFPDYIDIDEPNIDKIFSPH